MMNVQEDYGLYGTQNRHSKHFDYLDQNQPKDFSSVENLVKLPQMKQITPSESKYSPNKDVFPPVEPELINSTYISENLKETMISLRENLRTQFKTFEYSKKINFQFPESKFPAVEPGKRNIISYEQKNIVEEEDTFRDRLSSEQIQQIQQNGEFKVKSNHQYITLPYVWKVNDSLFRGKKNIVLGWYKGIARAHEYKTYAKKMYSKEIPNELRKISKLPMRLFSLIFGSKSMQTTSPIDYNRQVAKDFWNEVMDKYYVKSSEWGSFLFEYLDNGYKAQDFVTIKYQDEEQGSEKRKEYDEKVKKQQKERVKYNERVRLNNEKKEKISVIGDEFERRWSKSKKKVFEQVSRQYQQEEKNKKKEETLQLQLGSSENSDLLGEKQKVQQENILQKLNQKKFSLYTEYLQRKLPSISVPDNVITSLVSLLTIMQIITQKQRKLSSKLAKQRTKIQNDVKQKHKILSYDSQWYQQEVNRRYKPIEENIHIEYYNKFIDLEFTKRFSIKQKQTYFLWLQYRAKYDAYIEAKKKQYPEIQQPTRTFYTTYELLPPYKVIQHNQNNYKWYEMVRRGNMQITTEKNFWKLDLYVMRAKSWTINCLVFLVYNCFKGPFGLRCLWGTVQFTHDQTIDYQTGQIVNLTRKPFIMVFKTVLEGIKKSRQHFEALPDRGLFGKNLSRYFNYAECYIFRFMIVGVFITLILYPLAIIFLSILTFVLVLTVWFWIPIVLLVTYLFNTLFFQFQSSYIPHGFFIRAAPTFSLAFSLVRSVLAIILIFIFTFIISPFVGLLIILWTYICRGFRTLTDFVMLFLIRKLGRTPSRNTAIAKKISGPGMSKQYYMSINEEDVYILVQSQLQQIFMNQFNRIWLQKVNKPVETFNEVMRLLMAPLSSNQYYTQYFNNPLIYNNVNELRNLFQTSYQLYMNRYPSRPYNIRFTQQEIDSYFQNTIKIVENFVTKKQIQSWIFDQFHILHGDYQELTRKVWMAVFSCGQEIFEPLQKIDQRFKLEDMYKDNYDYDEDATSSYGKMSGGGSMKKNVHKVMEALQGEVELKPRRANINAYKHNLLHRQWSAIGVRQVFNHLTNNSDNNVSFSTTQTKFVFYPHLAIKEVIKQDKYNYESSVQNYNKNKK